MISIQKYLQISGAGSRREIRASIQQGQVRKNHQVIRDPNTPIDNARDLVHYHNRLIRGTLQFYYYLFYKPRNVITSLSDPRGRPTVADYIRKIRHRVVPVGRLDFKSEGLLFLTNDGDLTHFIISVRNRVPKTYTVKLTGNINQSDLDHIIQKGIFIENRKVIPLALRKLNDRKNCRVLIKINEGKKHIVRNIFKYSGYTVRQLKRTEIGTFKLGSLKPGEFRAVTSRELKIFKDRYGYPA